MIERILFGVLGLIFVLLAMRTESELRAARRSCVILFAELREVKQKLEVLKKSINGRNLN